jgi:undecaprenyl-diphosphatase
VLAAGAAAVLSLGGLFAEITDDVLEQDDLTALDRPVLGWLAGQRSPTMTAIQIGITNLGSTPALAAMLAVAAAMVSLRLRSWRPVIVTVIGGGGIGLLVWAIKLLIARARPDLDGRLVAVTGFSFPSGHSASSLVCFGLLAWLVCLTTRDHTVWATAWLAAALLTVAVGLSRAYLGVHYPSDVVGGWILGGTWLTALAAAAFVVRRSRSPAVTSSGA